MRISRLEFAAQEFPLSQTAILKTILHDKLRILTSDKGLAIQNLYVSLTC